MREFVAAVLLAVVAALVAVLFAWSGATHEQRNAFTSLCWIRSCPAAAPDDDDGPHTMTDNSYWLHDGALAYLRIEGARRRLYHDPRQTLSDADDDDDPDDMLFEGTDDNGHWRGTAQLYDWRCDSRYPYRVEGGPRDGDRIITLTGHAPRVAEDCNVAGYDAKADTLLFAFVREAD
jgi:hypothetical protein